MRRGRRKLVAVSELERWLERNGEATSGRNAATARRDQRAGAARRGGHPPRRSERVMADEGIEVRHESVPVAGGRPLQLRTDLPRERLEPARAQAHPQVLPDPRRRQGLAPGRRGRGPPRRAPRGRRAAARRRDRATARGDGRGDVPHPRTPAIQAHHQARRRADLPAARRRALRPLAARQARPPGAAGVRRRARRRRHEPEHDRGHDPAAAAACTAGPEPAASSASTRPTASSCPRSPPASASRRHRRTRPACSPPSRTTTARSGPPPCWPAPAAASCSRSTGRTSN